jgi:hypothetical protein
MGTAFAKPLLTQHNRDSERAQTSMLPARLEPIISVFEWWTAINTIHRAATVFVGPTVCHVSMHRSNERGNLLHWNQSTLKWLRSCWTSFFDINRCSVIGEYGIPGSVFSCFGGQSTQSHKWIAVLLNLDHQLIHSLLFFLPWKNGQYRPVNSVRSFG